MVGLFVMAVGLGLAAAPWWSATLGRDDYPLVWVLGALFGGIGLYAALPGDRLPRLRAFAFVLFLGAFGVVCAALALAPSAPGADGTYAIGGVMGVRGMPIPWWARIVAGTFALLFLGLALTGLWGMVRGTGRRGDDESPRLP